MQMLRSLSIDTVMKKDALLDTLRENRNRHATMYQEALEGYIEACKAKLSRELDKMKDGKARSIHISLSVPSDHTAEYDTIIGMLERDVRDTVKMTSAEYRMLVEDEWDWLDRWLTANMGYSNTAAEYAASKNINS